MMDERSDQSLIEALEELDGLIVEQPGDGRLLMEKARLLCELSRVDEAVSTARVALECELDDSQSWGAWFILGMDAERRLQFAEAVDCYERMLKGKYDFNSLTVLAAAQLETDPQAARDHATEALELNPDWDEAVHVLRSAEERLKSGGPH